MGISAEIALSAANGYTDETVAGGGAIKGKNCTIDTPIGEIEGGHRVNFRWYLDNGTEKTASMDVMNGEGVPEGGSAGQILMKTSSEDFATTWFDSEVRHTYNVQYHGIVPNDATKASANVTALQALIDTVPAGSVIYFPVGRYDFDDGVTIGKRLAFLGEDTNFKTATANGGDTQPRSQIVLTTDFPENTTMFNRTDAVAVAFKHLSILCDTSGGTNMFYQQPENTATFTGYPYTYYVLPETFEIPGVNGIDASLDGMFEISDCYFRGFTGYAIKVRKHRFIDNCGFEYCNHCIEVTNTDSWISNCWFRSSHTGIYTSTVTSTLLGVSDTWCDQMAGHFIHCANPKNGSAAGNVTLLVDNAWCDMIDQSAIYVETTSYMVQSRISGRFSRVGMTYAGLPNSEWTKEKSPLADVIFAARYDHCEFDISAPKREIHKIGSTSYESPCKVLGLYNSGGYVHNSRIICQSTAFEDVVPVSSSAATDLKPIVTGYNCKDVSIICREGEFRPFSNFTYKVPIIHTRSVTPIGNVLPSRANEFAIDTSTNTLYRSTGTTNTDWVVVSISLASLQAVLTASDDFAAFKSTVLAL